MDLKEKTTGKLENELKLLKISTSFLAGVLFLFFAVCIYGLLMRDDDVFSSLVIVPIVMSAMIPINYQNIKKIEEELKSRK